MVYENVLLNSLDRASGELRNCPKIEFTAGFTS